MIRIIKSMTFLKKVGKTDFKLCLVRRVLGIRCWALGKNCWFNFSFFIFNFSLPKPARVFVAASFFLCFSSCTGNPFNWEKGGHVREASIVPAATIIRGEGYKVLEKAEGESSTYMFLGLIPMTDPLNIELAMSQAVQKVEGGQSLVNVEIWHETHYYFPVGKVSVLKVRGDVVSFATGDQLFQDKKGKEIKPTETSPGLKVPASKDEGGLKVGGKKKKGGIKIGGDP
jgi:hypothetical protein